jgi:hypothetical protein
VVNDRLEVMLRDALEGLADEAPPAGDLAATARGRLRRRRQRLAAATAGGAALAVVAAAALLGGARTESSGPAGEVRVEPSPPVSVTVSPPVSISVGYCPAGDDCPDARAIDELRRRPVKLPTVPAGGACPVSAAQLQPEGGGFSGSYLAIGEGPFRMTGDGQVTYEYPPGPDSGYEGTGWGGQKVIWSIDASYSGPVLLRGAQIDGTHQLRFDRYVGALGQDSGSTAHPELAYPALPGGEVVRTPPSAVRLQQPGCYAIQVDGTSFSSVIVFRATVRP